MQSPEINRLTGGTKLFWFEVMQIPSLVRLIERGQKTSRYHSAPLSIAQSPCRVYLPVEDRQQGDFQFSIPFATEQPKNNFPLSPPLL
jgi:hypothetical protein